MIAQGMLASMSHCYYVVSKQNEIQQRNADLNIAKVSKAHIPPAVAIRGHTTLRQKADLSCITGKPAGCICENRLS